MVCGSWKQEAKHAKKAWKQTALRDLNIVICSKKAVNAWISWVESWDTIHCCLLATKAYTDPQSSQQAIAEASNSFKNIHNIKSEVHFFTAYTPCTHAFPHHLPSSLLPSWRGQGKTREGGCATWTATAEGALGLGWRRAGKDHLGIGGRGGAPLSLRLDPPWWKNRQNINFG